MRQLTALASALLISACGDVADDRHDTWREAKRAGAVERGLVPPFVPTTARNLRSVHDIDTNSQRLTFRLTPQAVQAMIDDIAPLARLNGNMLQKAVREVGEGTGAGTTNVAYMMCTNTFSAVIVVEPVNGDVAYLSPAEWGRASCPSPF